MYRLWRSGCHPPAVEWTGDEKVGCMGFEARRGGLREGGGGDEHGHGGRPSRWGVCWNGGDWRTR